MKYKLEDICNQIYSGGTPSTSHKEYWGGNLPWLSSGETSQRFIYTTEKYITEHGVKNSSTKFAKKFSTVMASAGQGHTRGQTSFLMNDMYVNQSVLVFEPNTYMVEPLFLFYNLNGRYEELRQLSDGTSTRGSLSGRIVKGMEIDLPNLRIQKKIVNILYGIDKKIEINTKINRNLSEQVAALYKAWFIDFERNDGVCPEEWKEATLGDIAEIGSGKRPPMKQTDKTDDVCIPLIGAASIMGYTNSVLYDSKILVTGRVGTHGVVQRFNNECWPSDNTLVITTDKYEFVNQILLRIDYKSMNRGSTQPLITQGDLKKTEIILPTDAILDEFEALAGGLMNQYEKNILENAKLSELRDTLLPKLMSGELDVSDMDF